MVGGVVPGELTKLVESAIADGAFPGAAFAVGKDDQVWFGYAGRHRYDSASPKVGPDTLWDMASCTKVVGTTPAAMLLFDDGALRLETRVQEILPGFAGDGKSVVKVRDLLLHESGLPAYASLQSRCRTPEESRKAVLELPLQYQAGTKTVYSCMGFITLYQVIEKVAGKGIDRLLRERLFGPAGMKGACYNPTPALRKKCAPTEKLDSWRPKIEDERGFKRVDPLYTQGEVHDPAALMVGGVSGNAGLFCTAGDVAAYLKMMLHNGKADGRQVLCARTVSEWTKRNSLRSTRGLGWDTKSPEGSSSGAKFSMASFGHTGYTGTCVWVDPEARIFATLLANRVHPTSENLKISDFRPKFHDLVYDLLVR